MAKKFISGSEYRLRDLFGEDTKIVIPDLQRDYCWGDKAYSPSKEEKPRELVTDFIKNIIEIFKDGNTSRTTLGLIYGYEQPRNNIQICDGQQRLTTLFLLLGYVNLKSDNEFRSYIISDNEMKDDFEPHLQYAIRESTLYFLSDLSRYVFIEGTTELHKIRMSDWYFNEYEQDASIQSIMKALEKIDDYFTNEIKDDSFNYTEFGRFILEKLYVLYYDMENRSRGEETYVVINTTGEPLSATENIKPLLLGNPALSKFEVEKYSCQWEDREEWFWQNKGEDKIADKGMLEFFVWYWQIGLMQESRWIDNQRFSLNPRELFLKAPKRINESDDDHEPKFSDENYIKFKSLDNLHKYFQALKTLLLTISKSEKLKSLLLSIKKKKGQKETMDSIPEIWGWMRLADLDIVLPLITYVAEHGINDLYKFARRLRKNHYDGIWSKTDNEQTRRGKNYIDWRYLIQIINQTEDSDIFTVDTRTLDFVKIPNVSVPVWYNEDEKIKQSLQGSELNIEEMEDNEYLQGDLTPLWKSWSGEILDVTVVTHRWKMLNRMIDALNPEKSLDEIPFSNWFRLYRLISGLIRLSHINYCISDFEGVYYSAKPDNPWWIETKQIEDLLNSNDATDFIRNYVREQSAAFIKHPQNHHELVMSWMTIKTLKAQIGNYLLNHWSGRAISAFSEMKRNYIVPSDDFHWGNIYCGFSYSYTVYPARDEYNWEKPENFDSPLCPLKFIPDFYNRDKDVIDLETIEKRDAEIHQIIDTFLKTQDSNLIREC